MTTETVFWATKIDEPDYMEQIITTNAARIDEAKVWATANGFNRFRVVVLDMNIKPDFSKVLNTRKPRKTTK